MLKKKYKSIRIILIFYLISSYISYGLNNSWGIISFIKNNSFGFLGFCIGLFLLYYFDKDL